MSPLTRNIALTAASTLLPALIGFLVAPERTRSLPDRIGHRVRGLLENDDTVEANLHRISARLEDLSRQLDVHGSQAMKRMHETSPTTRLVAGLAALVVIPAALTAIFAPGRLRQAGARDADPARNRGNAFSDLEEDLEKQRSDAVSAVSDAARRSD